nr:hypothetical protein [Actinomycetes bacterium]
MFELSQTKVSQTEGSQTEGSQAVGSQTAGSQTVARSTVDLIRSSWRAKNQADAQMLVGIGDLFRWRLRETGECASWSADTTD